MAGTFVNLGRSACMRDTERKAKAGMYRFAIILFGVALLLAGSYIVFWTPGAAERQPSPNAIHQPE
jgi:type II secretory pathway component PulM